MITDQLEDLLARSLDVVAERGLIETPVPEPKFERPRNREHGDWATNVALAAKRAAGVSPRDVAQAIVEALGESDLVDAVEVAGPGFLNFRLSQRWLHEVVRRAADDAVEFGRSDGGSGKRVNVEYVSANPTGPINVVSGRHAAVGDTISNLLEATGHEVVREFYVNDVGRQIELFGASIAARYMQALGHEAEFPEDGYHGDYVTDLGGAFAVEFGEKLVALPEDERVERFAKLGVERMLQQMKASLETFGTKHDLWFLQSSLFKDDLVDQAIEKLRAEGFIEEREGAIWFLSSKFGDDKDRVVIKANGEPTYLASDIAYLKNKFDRGFERLIYLWGADHHGTIPRLLAAAEAEGYERDRVEIKLLQIVTVSTGGESVKSSKRAGVIVPLDELVREVGKDAARYVFLTRSLDAPLDFDIQLAKEQAPENPVYYVQYAHARICSILRKASGEGHVPDPSGAPLESLHHPSEDELMRKLASYEEVIPDAARLRSPQKVTRYVEELASTFSAFYRDCKVVTDDADLTKARLSLCVATKRVVADGLGLLGVSAPDRM
ncbi:MAG: arginyl-tRNA synthetase [Actinomycetota bacterium]|nr:arginyl-tRNA synthetase [Actinomycetota bacterium]